MNNKPNIEELKYLIPDYITGQIDEKDKKAVEDGLAEHAELREFCNEMRGTFEFVSSAKFEEPSVQYWANLLPRIHARIEEQEAKKFSWDKIASFWKVLVPVAAVILIAVIYFAVKPSETQLTKEEKKTEEINNDSNKQNEKNQNKEEKPEQKQIERKQPESKQPENKQPENFVKEQENNTPNKRRDVKINKNDIGNVAKDETPVKDNNKKEPEEVKEDIAAIEVEDTSVFSTGEAGGFDEELENDLKKLDNNEQDMLLKELLNSNL